LVKEASSSITLESVIKEHKFVSTHTHSLKNVVEKTITMGKLEGSVEVRIFLYIYTHTLLDSVIFWNCGIR